ncbi:nitronate monooxygenase family protein [Paenibacillus sp. S150]|uniref:NAD(P)H-dependent flavin oxidoreductase n=1 Tax=Paenibacillus sp. S150 TaxID=2749826 RepID=UPI001C561F39|nr:nitronate monooxygenase [Paenibacillus sp. S150]MBW4083413.1 nitronate monooxygenase [Paenibacillus sp. S150]
MNRITEILNIQYPIIQAPMAWITSAELVAAVSNAGGMGTLGANAGQTTVTTDPVETGERMRAQIRKTRTLTDKPFAVNYMLPRAGNDEATQLSNAFSEVILKVVCEEKVEYIAAVGDINAEAIKRLKELGLTVIYRALNPTIENSKQAEALGVDIIVATGFDEGGGMPSKSIGTFSIVPIIADSVSIPIMAAGGIVDNRGFKAALALGAEGAYVGTAFMVAEECVTSDACKQDIIDTESTDLLLYKALPGYWRATPHKLAFECYEKYKQGETVLEIAKTMKGTQGPKIAQLDGDLDNGINSVNSAISLIKEIRTCQAIIDDMVKGLNI